MKPPLSLIIESPSKHTVASKPAQMDSIQHMTPPMMAMNYGAVVQEMSGLKAENENMRQQLNEVKAKKEARLEKKREQRAARRAASLQSMAALPASPVPEPVPAVVIEVAPAAPAPVTPATAARRRREFNKLNEAMPYGTAVYVESLGERFAATYIPQGFVNQVCSVIYASPYAMSEAHASRITAIHPQPTKPGNGWLWVKLAATDQSIGEAYDAHFAA